MATLTIALVHPSISASSVSTFVDSDVLRLVTAMKSYLTRLGLITGTETNVQVMDVMIQRIMAEIKSQVLAEEKRAASISAAAGVTPIVTS